uniref:Microtubule actin crosslinking factor 1 n=1 Tax=Electrophorus electricus TaxID=8005 RepID=A0A4W4GDU7_ELEEL
MATTSTEELTVGGRGRRREEVEYPIERGGDGEGGVEFEERTSKEGLMAAVGSGTILGLTASLHWHERDRVQKKTFTKWVNKHLIKVRKHITDLYEDLRDGHNLISLLEVLSGVTLVREHTCPREKGRMRFHRLQNVQIALDFLKQRQVKLVNIRNDDITDGNPKLTLGLIWTIILHFQISEIYVSGESADLTAKEKLLLWTQQATENYPGLRCVNFSSSWSDGRMFNALLHRYRPDLIDMELVAQQSNRDNLEQAFEIAESLGVTRLLDAEDVDVPSPDEKSVITYVSSIYDAFPKIPEGGEGIKPHEVDQRWAEYQSRFSSLLQWVGQHTALMASRSFPHNPIELKALYNEYVHFKETEIPTKEMEKAHIAHLYKLLEVWIEFGRIKLPQGLHPNDLEEEWGKLILEMLDREKALRPAVERLELLLLMANKIQNMAVDCEEKLTLAKNTLQADMSRLEGGEPACCEQELAVYLQDCEALLQLLHQDLQVLRDKKYYQVEQLALRVTCLQEELVSLRLQCASVYRKGHFSSGPLQVAPTAQRMPPGNKSTFTVPGAESSGVALLRRPMTRAELVAVSSSEDEGSLRFLYELLGWVEKTQELLERADWGSDLPTVEQHLQDHLSIHTAVEELLHNLKDARSYEASISPSFRSSYSETLAKLENRYCRLLEHSSWRLRCLESLRAFVSHCTEELIWLNEKEEEELAFDWSDNNTNMAAKREQYSEMKSELEEKQEVMCSLQETADQLCQDNHPAKQTVEAYSAALQTQWQWVKQLCVCVEQHLKDNTAFFQFTSDLRECETYLRQLQDTIKRQYTCDRGSRLGKLEDLLQDSMEEKEQLIGYRSSVASLVGRAKTVVQIHPRSADCILGTTMPIRAICDYRQIEITLSKGEECVLEDNSQRTKWKIISPTGNEAMVPSVCFTIPPPNQEAMDTASRMEQLYQNVMFLWHQLHMNMKSVVSWHYLQKDISYISSWTLDTVRSQSPSERKQALDHLDAHLADFLADSRESDLFTPTERRELEREAESSHQHLEKDESLFRSYLSELQSIKSHLQGAEQRLMKGMRSPPPSGLSGDGADTAVHIAEQEKLQQDLKGLQSNLGDVSRRCVNFFEEKPTSSSVPTLRSELNLAVEQAERLNSLSTVYLHKLKTVDLLMRSLQAAESQVKKYESRLSEEDIVPADTAAIQALREQLRVKLDQQDHVFQALSSEMQRAREVGTQLSQLHPDRSPELERYQEKAQQLTERWHGVRRQIETRQADLEVLGSVLHQYRDGHSALICWIEETTEKQENTQPEQTDSRVLSEQLAQQTALVAEIEQNQVKLDECQTHSKHYCTAVKDYELQLMTFRAFVESTQKSPVKRRRIHSSSDAITQEFMDLRTRYTALVTLTTQHIKYISDALRRLEEEEKQIEEEKQARAGQVSELLGWVKDLQQRAEGPAMSSLTAQQVGLEQLTAKKEVVAEAIRSTQVFLLSKQASKLAPEERAQVTSQLDQLTATYSQLCDSSAAQLQQLEEQLAKEEKCKTIAGVIDLGTVETFPVFQSACRGLIDKDTCLVLLEAQLIKGGLLQPDSLQSLSLEEGLVSGLIDNRTYKSLSELETALHLLQQSQFLPCHLVPVAAAMEVGQIKEQVGLRILELQLSTGGFRNATNNKILTLEGAREEGLISVAVYNKLRSQVDRRELIDPNTAEKLSLSEFHQRCILNEDTGLRLLPVNQQSRGTVCLRSGRKVGIFRAVQEGLIDREVTIRLLEAQLFAGGISDPRSGHRLTVDEAVRHGLMDQDLACALLTHQLQADGIIDPVSRERVELDEAIRRDLISPRMALRVLESLWAFMGILWPETGELLPISEALQQGVISGGLARNVLTKRHSIAAIYCPESGQVVPLDHAEEMMGMEAAKVLIETEVPDVLPAMTWTGSLNVNHWGSSSSPPASPPYLQCDVSFLGASAPEEQAKHCLLSYIITHSYINARSGERLVLLEPELMELVNANGSAKDSKKPEQLRKHSRRGESEFVMPFSTTEHKSPKDWKEASTLNIFKVNEQDKLIISDDHITNVIDQTLSKTDRVKIPLEGAAALKETCSTDKTLVNLPGTGSKLAEIVPESQISPLFLKQLNILPTNSMPDSLSPQVDKTRKKEKPLGLTEPESTDLCMLEENKVESAQSKQKDLDIKAENTAAEIFKYTTEKNLYDQLDEKDKSNKTNVLGITTHSVELQKTDILNINKQMSDQKDVNKNAEKSDSTQIKKTKSKEPSEDVELENMAEELLQGGLLSDGANKLLLDEAVSQGLLPGHTALKVMLKAGLFGGFLDVSTCESLSIEDVMQEGLLDEDLLTSVLQSEKTLAGVVDAERCQICSLKEAAQMGLLDPDTVAHLLEAQVVSGGIVDVRRGTKVSVTLAGSLGLIEEDQQDALLALEKSCRGKGSDPHASRTKLTLQLQMDGVVDPEIKRPVPFQKALQQGMISQEEAQQILLQQVAEGGIVHHGSGIRLTVTDAVCKGLIDDSLAPKLEEFEKSYEVQDQIISDPNTVYLQASAGFIYASTSKTRLTLTEAVSQGIIDKDTANKAMALPSVKSAVLDPHNAQVVPYSELLNQGKIDIETGQRFLEVRPFRGIPNKQNGDMMTVPEAVKAGQVDPIPALRILQSQADSGGIIDISSGKRLPLLEAVAKGLVEKDVAKVIATNQFFKGGLFSPVSGQRVSSLKEAVQEGLISREMAAELWDNFRSQTRTEIERVEGLEVEPLNSVTPHLEPSKMNASLPVDAIEKETGKDVEDFLQKEDKDLEASKFGLVMYGEGAESDDIKEAISFNQKSVENVKVEKNLDGTKTNDLSETLHVRDSNNMTRKENEIDKKSTEDIKVETKVTVSLEVLQPPYMGVASYVKVTENKFVKEVLDKSVKDDVKLGEEAKVHLEVQAQDTSAVDKESIEDDANIKREVKVDLEVRQTPDIKEGLLVVELENENNDVNVDQKSEDKYVKVELSGGPVCPPTDNIVAFPVDLFLREQSSLVRQECLEHDQQIMALLSMVRHNEVCLKQQQQQSIGRSLIVLDDIIKQTEALVLELSDLEPQVNMELEAARQLVESCPPNVPPQLLTALEKDRQSLSRAFNVARERAQLQGRIQSQVRASDVSAVAFDIQVFVSEHAQDLLPEQSRLLLAQLQQLQQAFHQASGRTHARAQTLAEQQQLQAQQAHLLQVEQSTRSLLEQPDSSVPPEEKQRLRARLDDLQIQHQERLQNCQERLRRTEALRDELAKFLQEHGNLGAWLEQSEHELCALGGGETDLLLVHVFQLAEDLICHKADLRFVSISGEKVLDLVQGTLERTGTTNPALENTRQLVSDKLQDSTQRYNSLQSKSVDLGARLSSLLDRYQQYQDEVSALDSWLSAQEQNQSIVKPSRENMDTQTLQNALNTIQVRAAMVRIEASQRTFLWSEGSRFGSLSESVSQRAEQLQTAVAQSVSVQEGLKALLAWLDGLVLAPSPVQPTARAVQEALTQNQKLRQELLSRQGSVEATRDSVSKLLKSADATTVSGLQRALEDLSQRYAAAQTKQAEKEAELRAVLPKLERFERLSADLRNFTQSRQRALSPGGQPEHSLTQEANQMKSFVELGTDLSQSGVLASAHCLLDLTNEASGEFAQLEIRVNERLNAIQSCEQQLEQFRLLYGSLFRWLQATQEQVAAKEPSLSTEGLQRRVQQLKDLLSEWESKDSRVQELNKSGSELENLIISITAPQNKGVDQVNGAGNSSSVNGIHTCKDLTEIQVAVAEVNTKYEQLGGDLQERQSRQQASLDLHQTARQATDALLQWLGPREQSLAQGQAASPSRPEVVRAQAQENKALLSELTEHSGKVEDLKKTLKQLITENPDSPEAEMWKQQLRDIGGERTNQTAEQRQTELDTCADRLGSFATAANQLGPWLQEKELMMSVLGPLSIDPNMLNTQKQQVQFMLREFETRRPQFDQLTQAAQGILSPSGDQGSGEGQDLAEVNQELDAITHQWEDLTSRLSGRSEHIDQAHDTSKRFQALLRELSLSMAILGEKLDGQASLSAKPEALRHRLQETGEIRAELEQRRGQLDQAEQLCMELSAIVAEPYLREELHKRLESVRVPLNSLEERAADGLSQLQAALSSTQQFQQMSEELRNWLDCQADEGMAGASGPLPCQPEALRILLGQQEEVLRGVAQQRGSYELIQAEGVLLLATLPAGDEHSALQAKLTTLRQDWEGLNQHLTEMRAHINETLVRAEQYKQHHDVLLPWVTECEQREAELQPSLDPTALDAALQKARQLGLDLDRRIPLLESLNTAADLLLEESRAGEEEVRDEKAQLNRRVDCLSERLHSRMAQLEELGGRLKEFEDGRQAVDRRLEAARHQLEVQEALGPQACSSKSLERLRSQQEVLKSLRPQVVYLRDLAQGLVQDAPQAPDDSTEGGQRLVQQAQDTEREFGEVTEKVSCCTSLESRLQGVGEVQSRVRDVFSRLADLDDELDSLSPVGRDADSLASQAEAVRAFLTRLATLRAELEGHAGDCAAMLRKEGSSPDLLALRRETEALSRQAAKLTERGQGRLALVEAAEERVREFYARLMELQGLIDRAEEGLNTQGVVGTEVEVIKRQLQEFKAVEREQVDSIQPQLQHMNAVGQGLIQSAAKDTDTQALEHDLETTNLRWNSLNKRVAERIAQLQEALLHCGKFQDALEPLLSWLSDTEELIANQKPPSAEYRVVKAQIQEQKLLQRLLDDRRGTVEMIRAEGERIATTAEAQDREKIQRQLQSLGERWTALLGKASTRHRQLEELQVLALQFHETVEPLAEWLSSTERRLSSAEPMGTQASKITQQIGRHKALQEEVLTRGPEVDRLEALGQSLSSLSCTADCDWLSERMGAVRSGHMGLLDWCSRREALLEQALANAQLFGEDEVEVLNWLAEVAQRLAEVSVQSYQPELLADQHKLTLSLNEEIVSRKKTVDQAIKNGQALLKQTTGEEVLLIQEKLDGIKSRYAEMTAGSSKALRTLEQALQLSTRFATANEDLNKWLDSLEAELNNTEPDTTPAYQDRQKELKCVSAEKRLVLDTVNEVSSALLDLVPWRAREGLDRLVADANQRYRQADATITQRVQLVQAAIQRSQQYEEAVDAELTWVGETERKLASLGPLSLEPDVTGAQLQVQRAFNIDIIRHKDTVDQLLNTREDILESCGDQQREALKVKTDTLSARYEAVSQSHSERFSALEQAQVLVARFWETYEELEPWLGETEMLIGQLPPPAIDTDTLRQQQDQMRLLRDSIAEHKPHIDKLLKIGPQLAELSHQEGATMRQRYSEAESRYMTIKEEVKGRAAALDEAFSQSAQFHDKMDPLLETLEGAVQRLRQPPPVAAEVEKIREQLAEHRATGLELDKLLPSFSALCNRGEELITRAPHDDPAAQGQLLRLRSLWDEIRQRAEEREGKLQDVLDLAGKFWADMAALLSTLRDSQDIVKELEDPGVDPSLIKQQIEAAEAIKAETDGLREELEIVRTLGADLIFACGETEKPEVKKTIDEMNAAWEGLNRTWRERMEKLEEAMTASVQYQDALQGMFDYLDNAVIKLCDMPTIGTDLSTVKQQIEELKQFKVEVYQQQIDMEKLCHQGELLLKKVTDQTDRDMIQEPLTELRHLWDNLGEKITLRQHKLEGALLALGQFQHALSELQSWLSHTHATLDTQRPVSSDPKAIEIELAKHHVLRNDVLSHRATVETVNGAGSELLESSPGDEASHLRDQLDELNRSWESLLLKTEERQKLLEAALHQAEGFHGELEEFLQWLRRTESQLSAAKPTGGLPETAREQLQQHMELQAQVTQRAEQYLRLLDQGELMMLVRGGEEASPGTTQTQQNLALLENKWGSLNTKMDDRRAKLEEAVTLATGFQSSLQDTINWLTQTEQTLNMAQPPSLILDTILFQIDEHKVFVNEVNTHREQVLALEKSGSQLRFASLKQDVVLIKNLLLSVQARWDKLVQRSLDRGRHLDEARKRAKQFHEAWRKLTDWLEEAESRLDSELEISNEPEKIKVQLAKHKEFQKALGSKQPVYDTTVRSGKAMRDKATLAADTQRLDNLLGEVRDKWDTVCGKSVERQHKLEEALLFSGQFAEALQALVDWLYRVEPQLAEDQPVHGDLDLVSNLMDSHKAFQKELGKRTSSVQALKRSARELMETGRDDSAWVKVQLQELSNRWDTVCALSVSKQTRLQQALKQAEEFRAAVQLLLEWLSEAEQTLRFRGVLPEEVETLQTLLHTHRDFMQKVEEKRVDVTKAAGMGEAILAVCHPDCITTIKHWITIIRARFEEVLTWAKQHEQRLQTALTELLNNASLLEELLSWLQWAETTLVQRDTEPLPQDIPQLKTLITEHQVFMEEMTRKQPDVDKVTKTYKRKAAEPPTSLAERRGARKSQPHQPQHSMQVTGGNPRLTQLCSRWQQVWLLALDRQRKLHDALDRLEELKEFANFDFDVWRKKYMRWMNHKKSRVMDFFRRIDKDQDGKITRQEFIDGILASKFPTSKLEMMAVADIFDRDGDGYIDYYEFVAALHPNKDAYRPTTDADKIEDEVTRQVAQCKCAKRFQVEQIGENKYRFFLGNQFGDSQQLRLVRILRSTVMVRVGGGWMALDEFLVKNDPCRVMPVGQYAKGVLPFVTPLPACINAARGRTNLELREKFILPEGASQGLAAFRSRGRRSKPSSRTASPTRSSSSASQSAQSCTSGPSAPATPTASSRVSVTHVQTHTHGGSASKIKRPTLHSSRGSLTGENGGTKPGRTASASGPTSRAGSRAGSRTSSRRGSDASDASELMETRSACSDTSDTSRRPGAKPSKIPTISKKTPSPKTPTGKQ